MKKRWGVFFLWGLVGLLLVAGCAGFSQTIAPESQISFTGKERGSGIFQTGRMEISYSYNKKGDSLEMEGAFTYGWNYDSLNIRGVLFDSSGKVVGEKLLFSTGFRLGSSRKTSNTFKDTIELVPGAVGFSFTYSSTERLGRP